MTLGDVLGFIEKMSTRLPALSWLGGFVFVLFAVFDFGNWKSVAIRQPHPAWWPLGLGVVLLALGYALKLIEPAQRDLESLLSGGLLYVLRALESAGDYRPANHFGRLLFHFSNQSAPLPQIANEGWDKASTYAVRCLCALGLVDQKGEEYIINKEGRATLQSHSVRSKFSKGFAPHLI
jgi:hypothetical protein